MPVAGCQLPVEPALRKGEWELVTGFRYHLLVHELAEKVLKTIRKKELIRPGDRVAAAVSGGADSVALLCLLLELRSELGIVLSVAHVNHKLRGEESDAEESFVAELAERHGLEFQLQIAPIITLFNSPGLAANVAPDVAPDVVPDVVPDDSTGHFSNARSGAPPREASFGERSGFGKGSGIEARARELRYSFFRQLAVDGRLTKIATAHTVDDQAETVLLRIFRGTGIRGLSGIQHRLRFEERGRLVGEVVRPLLDIRRAALQQFLRERKQKWREDSSNRDISFLRNRLRHGLLPMIAEDFGESAIEHMAELAEIARAEEEHWQLGHPEVRAWGESDEEERASHSASFFLPLRLMQGLSLAAQRRMVRGWLEVNARGSKTSFRLTSEALELARATVGKKMRCPGGWVVERGSHDLLLKREAVRGCRGAADYEYALAIPGTVEVPELNACIEAQVIDGERIGEAEGGQLLNVEGMPKSVLIRNWRAGDRYWPAHRASAKKVKELLSDIHATGDEKKLWPVAVAEGRGIIWMRGFAVPAEYRAPEGAAQAIRIREWRA